MKAVLGDSCSCFKVRMVGTDRWNVPSTSGRPKECKEHEESAHLKFLKFIFMVEKLLAVLISECQWKTLNTFFKVGLIVIK